MNMETPSNVKGQNPLNHNATTECNNKIITPSHANFVYVYNF